MSILPTRFAWVRQQCPPEAVLVAVLFLAVLVTGLLTPQAMIGDEVTHYYMLVGQADRLPEPSFVAEIPVGWGEPELRRYPHNFLWHYVGAIVFRLSGGSFGTVQAYQSLFWLQYLLVAWALAARSGLPHMGRVLYLVVLGTLPAALIFSVAFYQDIPVMAQVLTAFLLVFRGRWVLSAVFMALALSIKETALLFLPVYVLYIMVQMLSRPWAWRRWLTAGLVAVIVAAAIGVNAWALARYARAPYYPVVVIQKYLWRWEHWREQRRPAPQSAAQPAANASAPAQDQPAPARRILAPVNPYDERIISNHPGDLRVRKNYLIYGGGLLWLVAGAGLLCAAVRLCLLRRVVFQQWTAAWPVEGWLLLAGGVYTLATAYLLRTAPDARFFLPGLPFLLLPACRVVASLPLAGLWLPLLVVTGLLQGGAVLAKTYQLRNVSPATRELIAYLAKHPPDPQLVFMYPEGNYRLFPVKHNWYLSHTLREFWRGDNEVRLNALWGRDIGAVVIKKHLIGKVDDDITNLGVYPDYFVRDVAADPRFHKVFENSAAIVYTLPPNPRPRLR